VNGNRKVNKLEVTEIEEAMSVQTSECHTSYINVFLFTILSSKIIFGVKIFGLKSQT